MLIEFVNWFQATYSPATLFWSWGAIALSYALLHVVEIVRPAERSQPYSAIGANLKFTAVFLLLPPLVDYFTGHLVTTVIAWGGGPWFAFDLPKIVASQPEPLRLIALVPLAFLPMFVFDFFYYWYHRLQHMIGWLWDQHKLHHSDTAVNVTTSQRHHWSEMLLRAIMISIPMGLLIKMTPVEAGIVTMFLGQWGYVVHMNARVSLGPLSPILAGPQVHRIHHSVELHHIDKNFAAFFPLWDVIFGTYYHPQRDEFPATGVLGEQTDPPLSYILWGPLIAWYDRFSSDSRLGGPMNKVGWTGRSRCRQQQN